MDNITFLILLENFIFGFNCIISIALYLTNRAPIFRLMLIFWIATTCQFIAFGLVQTLTSNLAYEALIGNGIILLWINRVILEILHQLTDLEFRPKGYMLITIAGITLAFVANFFGFSFLVVATICIYSVCLPTIFWIWKIYRQKTNPSQLINLFILVYIFALIHLMDYPFLRLVDWFAPFGFTIHTAIHVGLAVILPSLLIKENLMKYNAELLARKNELKEKEFIIRSASSPITITSLDGTITYANPAFLTKWGYDNLEELKSLSFNELWNETPNAEQFQLNLLEGKGKWSGELEGINKDGSSFNVHVSAATVIDDKGKPVAYMSTSTDISDQKILEGQLIQAKEQAEAANKAKSEFLTNMSHELRTPMQGIIGYSRLGIAKGAKVSKEKLIEYFSIIYSSGRRLLMLLNDLLDLSKLESGMYLYHFEESEVSSLVHYVVNSLKPLANEKNITIKFIKPDFSDLAVFDKESITQVLINLLSNAIKFSEPENDIQIVLDHLESGLQVSVIDKGVSIPDNELESIFEKFVQSSRTRTAAGGTGLGLALCKKVINDHKGKIWAQNNPEGGSTLSFVIPNNVAN